MILIDIDWWLGLPHLDSENWNVGRILEAWMIELYRLSWNIGNEILAISHLKTQVPFCYVCLNGKPQNPTAYHHFSQIQINILGTSHYPLLNKPTSKVHQQIGTLSNKYNQASSMVMLSIKKEYVKKYSIGLCGFVTG